MQQTKLLDNHSQEEVLLEYSMGSTMIKYPKGNPIHIEEDDNRSITQSIIRGSRRGSTEVNLNNNMSKTQMERSTLNEVMAKSIQMA